MKQKLLNSFRLKATLLVAVLCATFTGTAWADTKELTFSVSSNPGGWPTTNSTTLTNYTYTLNAVNYTFGLSNVKCNSGYLMMTSIAVLGLPAIDGYKLTRVVASNSGSCSTSTRVGISSSSSSASYITGGAYQTWSTTSSSYTYNLSSTAANTVYYLYVTNKNAQVTQLVLTYESVVTNYAITKSATNGSISTQVSSSEVTEAAEDATVTITATPNTGYTFSSWSVTKTSGGAAVSVANASANPTTFTMPAEAVTVSATFTKNSYDLDLTNTNGTCAVTVDGDDWDGSSAIEYGAAVVITATPSSGYLFDAWDHTLTSPTISSNVISFSMPNEDVAIEAQFVSAASVKSITISDVIEHGTVTASANTAAAGTEITLTATPDTGYSFTSWSVKNASTDADITVTDNKFTMPDANVTVSATFTAIAVTGVSLNKTSASISVGETETLTATVAPANALNPAVTWTSSNTDVATVANGVVTAKAAGSATITVTTTDGSYTATCAVTVVNAVTFDATKDTGTSSIEKSGVSFACDNGVLNNSSEYRLYKNSTTTFSVSTGKITKIEFTGVSGNPASGFASQSGWTVVGNDGTWTGNSSSVSFTASGAQVRATEIKVYVSSTATPTFSVAEGEYTEAKDVTISCATDGATIYYTIDGSDPDENSEEYTSAVHITETTTLKAIAIKSGVESDVATATYTMNRPAAPAFDVAEGVFDAAFDLHLSTATDGATIYYTTNGSTPTTGSSVYSEKVAISAATTTVKAIAVKNGLTSDVSSAIYTYDSRTTPTFTLSTTSIDLTVNETSSAVSLTTNSDGDVTFTCADAHVTLTGTANSRTISANAAGIYTVIVTVTNSEDYKDAEGTITVTVTKKTTTMDLVTSFTSKDLYVTTSGSVTGTPKYNSSAIVGAEVTYTSSDETVATVADDGSVTYKKAGSTTITASYAGTAEYEECEASYNLDLIDSTPQEVEVTLNFNNTLYGTSYTGTNAANNGPFEGTTKGVTVTVTQGSSNNLYVNNSETRIYGGATKGNIKIDAPTGYVMKKIVFTTGTWDISSVSTGELDSKTWTGSASSMTIYANSRSDFQSAVVTLAETVTVGSVGYTTYVTKHDVSFDGVTAYIAKKVNAETETITLEKIEEAPLGTPVVIAASAGTHALDAIDTDPTVSGNLLLASNGSVTGNGTSIFALGVGKTGDNAGKVGFYLVNSGQTVPAGKAYLTIGGGGSVKGFTFSFSDADGIQTIDNGQLTIDNGQIFNLAGQRLSKMQKGINIVNGKKVLVK